VLSMDRPWRILQLADSGFPTGGFAHSAGLEAATQSGRVRSASDLDAHVGQHLWNVGTSSLPFVAAAHDNPSAAAAVDHLVDAFLTSHVANRASRTQGRAFLATCAQTFDLAPIRELASRARSGGGPSHLGPMFGATLAALGVERAGALALHLYLSLRGVMSAAVRLGVVGPYEAQRIQRRHETTLDAVLAACSSLAPDDAASVAPLLDIVGATHDRLYARLFQS
jgi:urease accessory protein